MSRIVRALVMTVVFGAGLLSDANAQDPAPGAAGTGDAEALPPEQQPLLSPQAQRDAAEKLVSRANRMSQRIAGLLDTARRDKDIIRVTCLNDKLTQINANARTAERRLDALEEAIRASDEDRRHHEYTVISVIGQKLSTLEQEANQCVGQDMYETGATDTSTEIDPSMVPFGDATAVSPPPPPAIPTIPPPASGTF